MFCKKCGKEIYDNSEYCEDCRNTSQTITQTDNNQPAKGKKCCPKCKSRNLQIVTNTEFSTQTTGGGYSAGKGCCGYILAGPLGLLCGSCGSKAKTTTTSKTTTAWTCLDCGNKFRDIADIENDINRLTKVAKILPIVLYVLGIIQLPSALMTFAIDVGVGVGLISLVLAIIFIAGGILYKNIMKKQIAALTEEKDDIEKNGYTIE